MTDISSYVENDEITSGEAALKSTSIFHSIIDKCKRFKFISNAVVCFLGYNAEEIAGENAAVFIHKNNRALFTEVLQNLTPGKTITLPAVALQCKNGSIKTAQVSLTDFSETEPFNGILAEFKFKHDDPIKQQIISSHSAFFAKHPFGVFHMSLDGVIDRINLQLILDSGYELTDLQGQPLLSFLLPKYRRKVFLMFYYAIKNAEPETYDVEVYTKKGKSLHANFTIIPVVYKNRTIEIYGVVKDISERLELQEALKRTSIVADNSLNAVVIMDSNRKIEWVNRGFTMMNGFTLEEAIGKDPSYLLKVEGISEQKIAAVKQILSEGESIKQELVCQKKDGSVYWISVQVIPVLNKNGKLERIISIHTDITEKKKADDDLKRFADDLYKQNKELHQFAYIVSHNLRSPVASIIGLANLLELYKDDPETLNYGLAKLLKAANNMDTVIKDLSNILEISNSSNQGLVKVEIDVIELLDQIQIDLKDVIANSSAKIMVPNGSCIIHTNKAYLYSIFYNLISNAIKYRSQSVPEIKISYQCNADKATFKVQDNGLGIDLNKNGEAVFKPYKRFNFDVEGKGLGLFLVKSHVEAFGGTIEVESEVGVGTTFIFSIPS